MPQLAKTYSFLDITLILDFSAVPGVGSVFVASGQKGLGQIMIDTLQERTTIDISADGTPMMTYLAGDQAHLSIEVQQTSDMHSFLLAQYNALVAAANGGDVTNWNAATAFIRS